MNNKHNQMPKEVTAVISNILKFLEKSEKDYITEKTTTPTDKEAKYENS